MHTCINTTFCLPLSHRLETLILTSNNIDSVACFTICAGVIENRGLKKVVLDGNPIGEQVCISAFLDLAVVCLYYFQYLVPRISQIKAKYSFCQFLLYHDFSSFLCREWKLWCWCRWSLETESRWGIVLHTLLSVADHNSIYSFLNFLSCFDFFAPNITK